MQAAVLDQPRIFQIVEADLAAPEPTEVRVRLQGCGVCASNLSPWAGRPWFSYPFPPGSPGHEGWGLVDAVGTSVDGLAIGDRVATLGQRAYATHDTVDVSKVARLPKMLHDEPFPGEPLACAFNVFRRSEVEPGMRVAVVGIGFMGAVLTTLYRHAGAHVIAISRRASSLHIAEQMGADEVVRMDDHDAIIRSIKTSNRGELCDRVVECAGAQWPLDLAAELTRERGRLVIAGYHQDGPRQVDMQMWNWRGLDVVNAHERDPAVYMQGLREAIVAVDDGWLDPLPLLTHAFPLEDIASAFEITERRPEGFVKALLRYE